MTEGFFSTDRATVSVVSEVSFTVERAFVVKDMPRYHQPCHGADAIAGSQGCSYSRHLKVVHSFVVVMLT